MSVIIRLQNLPWSANAHDIREFFKGLSIPEGGVHIVGGELGDAFIAFSSDEDARLAMQKSGTSLKGIQITLLLSSRTEMQKVIEAARQQALGIPSYMAPVTPVAPVQPVASVQAAAPVQLPPPPPPAQPQFQTPNNMQGHPQRIIPDEQVHQQINVGQNVYQGRPLQPNQHGQTFSQSYNPQQPAFANQMPFPGQKIPGFPPGVVVPQSGIPPHYYAQPPPVVPIPPTSSMPHHVQNTENTPPPNMPHNFSSIGHQTSNYSVSPSPSAAAPTQPQQEVEDEKKDKKLVSSLSSSTSRDKRDKDNKGRDERRRRSKSRSRSKDRDRRRRHRSRSRSRSRDKGGRRRRSRSRDRDRPRESTRDKERDRRERKDNRSHREKSERSSQETSAEPQEKVSENSGGIPGLGEIPDDIPKEGLSIFTQPPTTLVQTKETPPNSTWLKPLNATEPQPFNQPPQIPEKQTPPKPFLLANPPPPPPPPNPYGSPNLPPLLSDPPPMKNPPNIGSYNNSPSFKEESGSGNYKAPLLHPKDENPPPREYPPEDRRDWSHDSFDRRKYRDDDRNYRSQNHNRERNYDPAKPPQNVWEGSAWDSSKESDKGQHVEDWGRPFPRREDDYGYNRDKDTNFRNPDQGMQQDRRDHVYATRSFGGSGNFPSDYNGEYDDRYNRGGFRGRGRRGGFGRESDRGPEPSRMGGGFKDDDPSYRDRYPPDFDRNRGSRGLVRGRGGRGPPIPDYPRDRRTKTCSVEVRNVPTNASYSSIKELFNGILVPNGSIKILGGQRGERIGIALIQFTATRDAYEATRRSGGYIMDSRVQVNYIDDSIYLDAKDVGGSSDNNSNDSDQQMDISSSCVYVSGLQVGCTDHDVARLFEDFKVEDIVLELEKGSRQPSGGCFVRFISPEEAENALSELKHPNIDGAPVKVDICTLEALEIAAKEREKIKNRPSQTQQKHEKSNPSEIGTKEHLMALTHLKNNKNMERSKKNSSDASSNSFSQNGNDGSQNKGADLLTDSIVIKNVLSDITETSIRDFFSDEGLIPEKVYFNRPDSEGKCDVYVIFPKISDAKQAIKKNLQLLGSTEVTVELISKPTVMLAMGLPFNPRELFQKGDSENRPDEASRSDDENHEDYPVSDNTNFSSSSHFDNQYRDRDYNQRYNRHGESHQSGYRPRPPFNYRRDHDRYPQERSSYDDRSVSSGGEIVKSSAPPQDFGKPGCVVALANLPYHATTEDILSFFKDFDHLQPENIIRRYDERNRPTSDSRVCLASPEEALKSVKILNRGYILGRPIYISPVN